VAFAWIDELTPEGIRRTEAAGSPGARSEHANRQIGRKLNTLIIAVLVLAVALLGWRLYAVRHQTAAPIAAAAASSTDEVKRNPGVASAIAPASTTGAAASGLPDAAGASGASVAAIPAKSVAVLPFANEGEKSEQFFSDGLSEDLITALSQFAGLKVISRNSAFQFRDSKDTSAEIGKLLGVAHLLEGSVQRADDEVRITATLVNAGDGTVLWTQRYDKPYKDLFALQDDITHTVADALKAKLLTAPGAVVQSDRPPSGNLAAYAAYQRGQV
jgi:TolB-like protein